jgi:WD40 repeat protein
LSSWDFEGNLLRSFPGHLAIIDDVDISPNGKLVASSGRDFTLKIHDLESGALLQNISIGKRSPKSILFIDNDTVIICNYWGELLKIDLKEEKVPRLQVAQNGISGVAVRGNEALMSSYDGAVYLVDLQSMQIINQLRSMTQRVNSPAFEDVA